MILHALREDETDRSVCRGMHGQSLYVIHRVSRIAVKRVNVEKDTRDVSLCSRVRARVRDSTDPARLRLIKNVIKVGPAN